MKELIERLNDTFLPMAIGYLVSHPEIILFAYLVLKGRDMLFNKLLKPKAESRQLDGEKIPIVYETIESEEGIALSQDEIDDHFEHRI